MEKWCLAPLFHRVIVPPDARYWISNGSVTVVPFTVAATLYLPAGNNVAGSR